MNLTDDVWDVFEGVEMENGLEVWRLLNMEATQKPQCELLRFEYEVLRPARLKDIKSTRKEHTLSFAVLLKVKSELL